jgi:hypothetical protein
MEEIFSFSAQRSINRMPMTGFRFRYHTGMIVTRAGLNAVPVPILEQSSMILITCVLSAMDHFHHMKERVWESQNHRT